MKLNIYDGAQIVKTYEVQAFRLKWGLTKKLMTMLDLDKLSRFESATMEELITALQPLIANAGDVVAEIMNEMFPEITEDELDRTDVVELAACIAEAFKYVFATFAKLSGKN